MTATKDSLPVYELDVRGGYYGREGETPHEFFIFLVENGVHVAYMNGRFDEVGGCYENGEVNLEMGVSLSSIETRPGHRNQGLSKKLMELVKALYEVDVLYHSGGYTADGAAFVAKRCTRPRWADEPRSYHPMRFIEDWDKQILFYS